MAKRKVNKKPKKLCVGCNKEKLVEDFYMSNSKLFPDGRVNMCKECINEKTDVNDLESVKEMLRLLDKPFIDFVWAGCVNKQAPLGQYLRQMSSLHQYKELGYGDSKEGTVDAKELVPNDGDDIPEELYRKWGREFSKDEILEFEDLYNEMKNNYQIKTASHKEFLKHACITSIKAKKAMAKGDTKTAKEYMTMFKDSTSAGKLQPSQFSKADLSEGLDSFSQLIQKVEQAVDIIQILPEYKAKPRDKVDFTMWQFINYERQLHNFPLCEYKEIYEFMNERRKEYALKEPEAEEWI